ncbi:MAG TPA: hypothetical protein VFZ61_18960 [Polyangiales bacterium]
MARLGVLCALSACGKDDPGATGKACDFPADREHICSVLMGGVPSLDCEQRGGEPVARCAEGWSTSCETETRDGTYHFYGYDGVTQELIDARCEDQRQIIGMPPDNDLLQGKCSWVVEGDEASELGSQTGTCYLQGADGNGLAFRDSAVGRTASISTLDFTFFGRAPVTLKPDEGGLLTEFQLSVLARVKPAEPARNWYCSFISGRTQPRGTFQVELNQFRFQDGAGLTQYEGTAQAECPAAGEPAKGSLRVTVTFSGKR